MTSCPIISIVSELRHAHCCMSSYQSNSRSCVGTTRVGVKVQMTQFIRSLLSLSLLLYELWYQMKSPLVHPTFTSFLLFTTCPLPFAICPGYIGYIITTHMTSLSIVDLNVFFKHRNRILRKPIGAT